MKSEGKTIWVFTPSRTSQNILEAILVQRQRLLQDAVERVRESVLTAHKHHLLFVGPRGCGKTHLVTLIVSRLSADGELNDGMRIAWLHEDETCTTLLELFLKIHSALEIRYPDEYRPDMLGAAYDMQPEAALDFVSQHLLTTLGSRTLVVVAENLDAIFEGLGETGQEQLRAFIQENPRLAIVATAQRLVEDLSNRVKPFFGFFQTEHLKPLSVEEAIQLLKNIARIDQDSGVKDFLATSRGQARVRALHHLSGGNHRIYIVLSQFITRDSIEALVEPFMQMVDELTPYYQERIRWLPPLQRKIVECLCSCDGTLPVKEIAKRLFATPQTISNQLQALREKGYVEANQRGRESLYEISEPLMRICIEVKDSQRRQPLRLLVDFLRVWYDDQELQGRLTKLPAASTSCPYLESAIHRNSTEGNLRKRILLDGLGLSEPNDLLRELAAAPESVILAFERMKAGDATAAFTCLDEALAQEAKSSGQAAILYFRAALQEVSGEHEKSIDDYTAVIGLQDAPVDLVAKAHLDRGGRHGKIGEREKQIEDYTAVIGLEGAPVEQVAMALVNRGVVHGQMGEREKQIEDYTAVIGLRGASVEQVARARLNRGIAHEKIGEHEKEIEDHTAVIGLRGAPVKQVAMALLNRGIAHGEVGELEKEIEDYTTVIDLPGTPVEAVPIAYCLRGTAFLNKGQKREAQADLESAIRLPESPRTLVVDSHLGLAEIHFSEGRWNDGFQDLKMCLEIGAQVQPPHYGDASDLVGVVFSAGLDPKSRCEKASVLLGIYQQQDALSVLGEAIVRHIGGVFRTGTPFPSTDNLEGWALAWEEAAKAVPDSRLSIRLLRTGVDFIKSGGDRGVLLDLASTERAILEQAFGLAEDRQPKPVKTE